MTQSERVLVELWVKYAEPHERTAPEHGHGGGCGPTAVAIVMFPETPATAQPSGDPERHTSSNDRFTTARQSGFPRLRNPTNTTFHLPVGEHELDELLDGGKALDDELMLEDEETEELERLDELDELEEHGQSLAFAGGVGSGGRSPEQYGSL